ncbi:pentapeptide repeat-containing protein [Romboutsia sp.]|uniref:pentapeptide repeat-containing protein n=1 Tax=Romboutsia sp. TaxID=1965302 RepID=UPI002CF54504|nr:pentapeptide repeat-containing protein [Romboutsia sp.]HSQ87429.1 pentapeptide repeat-containing protein [Romboutsia sp.]
MQTHNFSKIRNEIDVDFKNRKFENEKKYGVKLELFKSKFSMKSEHIRGNSNISYDDIYKIENESKIIIKKIENKSIGEFKDKYNTRFEKLRNVEFKYNTFSNCKFKNIEFYNCTFYGNVFSNCQFKNIIFINCNFYNTNECISIFNSKTIFIDCQFKNCNIEKSIFENIDLHNIKFEHTNLKDAILKKIYINNVHITDCDCRSFKIINPDIKEFEFEDNYLTKFDEYTFIDKMNIDKRYKKNYVVAFKLYRGIASKFEANGLLNNAGEYYYISKCMEYKSLSGINKFKSAIFWLLCGYGERPTFALITSLEIVLVFAIIYMVTGLNVDEYVISYKDIFSQGIPIENLNPDFMKSLYFSIVTFTTVGYGDITPIGYSVLLSGIEMLLGVTMVGIWTATLTRKITR